MVLEFLDKNNICDGHYFDKNGHERWRTEKFEELIDGAWKALEEMHNAET